MLVTASPKMTDISFIERAAVWKIACIKGTYTKASCVNADIDTVTTSILFWNSPHPRPRFCTADTRSRNTKHENVYEKKSVWLAFKLIHEATQTTREKGQERSRHKKAPESEKRSQYAPSFAPSLTCYHPPAQIRIQTGSQSRLSTPKIAHDTVISE